MLIIACDYAHTSLCKHVSDKTVPLATVKMNTTRLFLDSPIEPGCCKIITAESITMTVNILEELVGFVTASKQDVFYVAHIDCYNPQLLRS